MTRQHDNQRFVLDSRYISLFLVGIVLLVGLAMGPDSFENPRKVCNYELAFIVFYILTLIPKKESIQWVDSHKAISILLLLLFIELSLYVFYLRVPVIIHIGLVFYLIIFQSHYITNLARKFKWPLIVISIFALSISLSYYLSPYMIYDKILGQDRYDQTLTHIIFFIVVWDHLRNSREAIIPTMVAISLSVILVAIGSIVFYLTLEPGSTSHMKWFGEPPFGAHMRHVGYQITAGLAVILPFLTFYRKSRKFTELFSAVAAVILWAFIIWSGGRSAMVSIVLDTAILSLLFTIKGLPIRRFILLVIATAIAGLVISEFLRVFPWNGLFQAVSRVVDAENAQQITSGRNNIWLTAWYAVKDHLIFGLGPQGFFFIPDSPRFAVQPHSMFIQFIVEWGIIGTFMFLSILIVAFYKGLKQYILNTNTNMLLASLSAGSVIIALTLHGVFDGTYYHPRPSFYLAIAFAVWLLPNVDERSESSL